MAHQQSILSSLDRLEQAGVVDFEQLPPAELLVEYRDLYLQMTKQRRARSFNTHALFHEADRSRAATERRVMEMANAVHRRSRAVSIDLHRARDRGPEAVLEALKIAIERHGAAQAPETSRAFSRQRLLWLAAAAASAGAVAIAFAAQLI